MTSVKERILAAASPAHRQRLVDFKNALWGGYRHHYYSQFGEDIVVAGLAKGKKKGFYIDVGANHPKRYSNTQLLFERGWHGINIDPNEETMKLFARARPRDINLTCGVAEEEGSLEYYPFSDPAYNTFNKENAQALQHKKWLEPLPVKNIAVLPLSQILKEHLPANTSIDFLNIDAEGMDMSVLRSNDWLTYHPKLIAIEDAEFVANAPHTSGAYAYLTERGYILKAYVGVTLIFALHAH